MTLDKMAALLHPWVCEGSMFAHYGPAKECERVAADILSELGFCPKDGDSMPCETCGAGL